MFSYPLKIFKSNIEELSVGNVKISVASSLPFLKKENGNSNVILALEVMMNVSTNYSSVLKEFFGKSIFDMTSWVQEAIQYNPDIIALKFNISEEKEIPVAVELLKKILKLSNQTFLITGSNKKNLDKLLLPELLAIIDRPCIIGIAEDETYTLIVEEVIKNNHAIIARTPMDINLAKELNIKLTEKGVKKDKILVDTNMAALGYGLDYGYSIIERVKLAGLDGDKMLNFPIVAFVGEEAWKAKEARISDFDENYGHFKERAIAWESATATSIMLAGANLLVLWHPEVLLNIRKFIEGI